MRLPTPPRALIRLLHTSPPTGAITLQTPSPFIRPLPPSHPSSSSSSSTLPHPNDFLFYPSFFDEQESKALLELALWKLDRVDSGRARSLRKGFRRGRRGVEGAGEKTGVEEVKEGLQGMFTGEYGFEEGHFDSVIHHYRETLLSSLPPSPSPLLLTTLSRLYSLLSTLPTPLQAHPTPTDLPPAGTLTHLLHLAPGGEILPHVDNLEASGRVICGACLGGERTMRLRRKKEDAQEGGEGEGWDVRLPSGSVYVQRDSVRYGYEHSILSYEDEGSVWDGKRLEAGHRVSVMIRDAPTRPANLG
ncbi:hypothetical protein IAT38_007672 [Cryptococcus sp. DSM 104549]